MTGIPQSSVIPELKLMLRFLLIMFVLIPECFTRDIEFTSVLETLSLQREHIGTNFSCLYSVNPTDPQSERR